MKDEVGVPLLVPLQEDEVGELSRLLMAQRPEYMAGFTPFAFDEGTLRTVVRSARKDQYWAIRSGQALAGLFMLRGLDEGFETPSFGVAVAEAHSGCGLAQRALAHAIQWCRARGIRRMMLKVAEDNAPALAVYGRAGFKPQGRCERTQHVVHVLDLEG